MHIAARAYARNGRLAIEYKVQHARAPPSAVYSAVRTCSVSLHASLPESLRVRLIV